MEWRATICAKVGFILIGILDFLKKLIASLHELELKMFGNLIFWRNRKLKMMELESDLELELNLATEGLGLSETCEDEFDSLLICLLQCLSDKPWIIVELKSKEFHNYTTEWDLLTDELGPRKYQFLCDFKALKKNDPKDFDGLLKLLFQTYFTKNKVSKVIIYSVNDRKDGENLLKEENVYKLAISETGNDDQAEINIRILKTQPGSSMRKTGYFRLIVQNRLLFPNDFDYAKELIDQINRFGFFRKYKTSEDLTNLSQQLSKEGKFRNFDNVFEMVFPSPAQSGCSTKNPAFILKFLKEVEPRLTPTELVDLRITLITYLTSEIYYPLRATVLKEKEEFERKSAEMVERQEWLARKCKELDIQIQIAESEHEELVKSANLKKSEVSYLKNKTTQRVGQMDAQTKKIQEIEAKMKSMREVKAFNTFLNGLYSLQPSPDILLGILNFPENWEMSWDVSKVFQNLLKVMKIQWPAHLKEQIDKKLPSDKSQIVEAINYIRGKPEIRLDRSGKLTIKGNHLILSNLMPELMSHLNVNDSIQEIHLVSRGNLVINTDMEGPQLQGKNLVIIGKHTIVPLPVRITVSGSNAPEHKFVKALDGVNNGIVGDDGLPGEPGQNGGDVYIEGLESMTKPENLQVDCCGGGGGYGQNGGNGAAGLNGTHGTNATALPEPSWGKSYFTSFEFIAKGTRGEPGKCGKHAGIGGLGGEGGKGGTFTLVGPAVKIPPKIYENGKTGSDGKPGSRGKDGVHGKHGKDHGWGKKGMWENSIQKWGFDLRAKEITDNWIFTGYEIVEGPEPPYPTLTRDNQNINHQKKKDAKKSATKIQINQGDVVNLRNSIQGAASTDLTSQFQQEESKLSSSLQSARNEYKMETEQGSLLARKLKEQEETLTRLERDEQSKRENILRMQTNLTQDELSMERAKDEEVSAIAMVKVLAKKAKELENEQKEVEKTTTVAQRQVLAQTHVRQNKLTRYTSVDIPDMHVPYARAPTLCGQIGDDDEFDVSAFHRNLNLNDYEMSKSVESCLQTVNLSLGEIPKNLKEFFQNSQNLNQNCFCGLEPQKYIRHKLANDVIVGDKYNFNDVAQSEASSCKQNSLFDLILSLRQSKIPNFTPSPHFLRIGPDLLAIMNEISDFETFEGIYKEWTTESTVDAESLGVTKLWNRIKNAKASAQAYWKGSTKQNVTDIQRILLERARDVYLELQEPLKITMKGFLTGFTKSVDNTNALDNDGCSEAQILQEYLETFNGFQFNSLSQNLDFLDSAKAFGFKNLSLILTKLPLHIGDMDEIQAKILRLKSTVQNEDYKVKGDLLNFETKLTQLYKSRVQHQKMKKIREICMSRGSLNSQLMVHVKQQEDILESVHLNLKFSDRKRSYESIQAQLERTEEVGAFRVYVQSSIFKPFLQRSLQALEPENQGEGEVTFAHLLHTTLPKVLLTHPPSEVKVKQFAFYFENVGLTLDEFAHVETSIWTNLRNDNYSWSHYLEIGIEKLAHEKFQSILSKYNFKLFQDTFKMIETMLLDFAPLESFPNESGITETTKTRKYIKFSMLRLELIMAAVGDLDFTPILDHRDKLEKLDKTNLKIVYEKMEDFYHVQLRKHLDQVMENLNEPEYLSSSETSISDTFLDQLTSNFDFLDYKLLYLKTLGMVQFENDNLEKLSIEKVEALKKKIDEKQGQNVSAITKMDLIRFREVLCSLTDKTADFPYSSVRDRLFAHSPMFKKFQETLRRISSKTGRFTTNPAHSEAECLFTTARYLNSMKTKILDKLNLKDLDFIERKLDNFDDEFMASLKIECTGLKEETQSSSKNFAFIRLFKILGSSSRLSFIHNEMDLIIRSSTHFDPWPSYFQILKQHCKEPSIEKQKNIWKVKRLEFKKMLEAATKNQKPNFQNEILKKILNCPLSHPLKKFLERILSKVLCFNKPIPGKQIVEDFDTIPESKFKSQKDLYNHLFPYFDIKKLSKLLLTETESNFLKFELPTSTVQKFQEIFTNVSPDKWAFKLEKLIFDNLLAKWTKSVSISRKNSDEFKTVFKNAYFLSSNRFDWLKLIEKLVKVLQSSKAYLQEENILNLFRFSQDLNLLTFKKLVKEKFTKNLVQSVLEECILQDLLKAYPCQDLEFKNPIKDIEKEYRESIFQFNREMCKEKFELLLILHPRLIQLAKSCCVTTNSEHDANLVLKIFKSLNKTKLHSKEMNECFKKYPLPYWLRIIREARLRSLTLPPSICNILLGMDEKFGEDLVDRLSQELEKLQLPEDQMNKLVKNFKSCEWIFDDDALQVLRQFGASFASELIKYSSDKRKVELPLEGLNLMCKCNICQVRPSVLDKRINHSKGTGLISSAKSHRLNSKNEMLIGNVHKRLIDIHHILNSDKFKFRTSSYEGRRALLKKWLGVLRPKKLQWQETLVNTTFGNELIALIVIAAELFYSKKEPGKDIKPRNAQLMTLLTLVDGTTQRSSRIGEIETGEGKSLIVAMFASYSAFLGANVNVITSNKVLAEEDSNKFTDFFALFDLTVSNNCDSKCQNDSNRKKRYNSNIIYGEVGCFQADILNTEFYMEKIAREIVDIVIVDEVDSLLLDKGANMLYLSHEIPELRHLKTILLVIWEAVQAKDCSADDFRQYSENDLNSVRKSVEKRIREDKSVLFPSCLKEFVKNRIGVWVKQGFRARFMPRNEDFIVDKGEKVINMDKDTGIELVSMQFSLALQQFLQLRSGTKMTPESLKCVFMSNLAYFNQYKGKVYGISGTLGDEDERILLRDKYGFEFFGMPRFKCNKMVEEEPVLCLKSEGNKLWLQGIQNSIKTHDKQPVLIISENIAKLETVKECLLEGEIEDLIHINDIGKITYVPDKRYLLEYKSSESDQDFTRLVSEAGGLTSNHIIISTNLAGRGTDLKIADIAKSLGLHVILTFLPTNMRVEKQAFGRTARAGESGTVQFVLVVDAGITTIENAKEERQIREMNRMNIITTRDIPRIALEDELFKLYNDFVKKEIRPSNHFQKFPKRMRELQISFLNNRWAVWLDSIRGHLDILHLHSDTREKMIGKFNSFKIEMLDLLNGSTYEAQPFAKFPSELIKCAILYEKLGTKTFLNTLSAAEFNDLGEMKTESLETIKAWLTRTGKVFSDTDGAVDLLNALRDYATRPTDLQIGINSLVKANSEEEVFSEAASAYTATLRLQEDPTAKKLSKKSLQESIRKIDKRIEQNLFCTELITLSNSHRNSRKETNVPIQHKLKVQMDSEINLLQHHLECIRSAFHSEITTSSVYSLITAVNSREEASEIFDEIMTLKTIVKPYRWSQKEFNEEKICSDLISKYSFLNIRYISECRLQGKALLKTSVELASPELAFVQLVMPKEDICQLLIKHGVVTQDQNQHFCVCLTENIRQNTKIKFPSVLETFEDGIVSIVTKQFGQLYNDELSAGAGEDSLKLSVDQKSVLKTFLVDAGWIREEKVYTISKEFVKGKKNRKSPTPAWDQTTFPEELKIYSTQILNLSFDSRNCQRKRLTSTLIEFYFRPPAEGSKIIFDHLVSIGLIKKPRVKFPTLDDHDKIQIQIKLLKDQLLTIKPKLEEIYKRHNGENDDDTDGNEKSSKLGFFKSTFLGAKARVKTAVGVEPKFEQHFDQINEFLLTSIGTLKRYPKIRVNYHDISSRVALESNQFCDELNEWKRERIFDRVFTFDESIALYENKATFIFILGAVEIAIGVAIEIASGGVLSPLAAFIISEGSSDLFYSTKLLWQGQRLYGADYTQYKIESLALNAIIPGSSSGTLLEKTFIRGITETLLREGGKALLFTAIETFLENNMKKSLDSNFAGLGDVLDGIMQTTDFSNEMKSFRSNAKHLRDVSHSSKDTETFLTKIVRPLGSSCLEEETLFDLHLEQLTRRLETRILQTTSKLLNKSTMPTRLLDLWGRFGNSKKGIASSEVEIAKLSVDTMTRFNAQVSEKIEILRERQESPQIKNDPEFDAFVNGLCTQIKADMKKKILARIYARMCSPVVFNKMKEEFTTTYGKSTYNAQFGGTGILAEDSDKNKNIENDESSGTSGKHALSENAIVSNAGDRSVRDVTELIAGYTNLEGEIEFLESNFGKCYLNFKSPDCPLLSLEIGALDEYLTISML